MSETDKKHRRFGGSTAARWLACPGSVKFSESMPLQVESEHMRRGTLAHALLEHELTWMEDAVLSFEGQTLPSAHRPGDEPFTREDVEAVQEAVVWVREQLSPSTYVGVEVEGDLAPDVGGTADVVIYDPVSQMLKVMDYKHGRGHFVEADAPQLKFYAAIAMQAMEAEGHEIRTVSTTVIQPRHHSYVEPRTALHDPVDIRSFAAFALDAVEAALQPQPILVPGRAQCEWCPARHVCPALRDSFSQPLAAAFPPKGDSITLHLPPPGDLRNPVVLGQTMQVFPVLREWMKAVEEAAYAAAISGSRVHGHKLVETQARRAYSDPDAAARFLSTIFSEDEYAPRELVSPAQAEKIAKRLPPDERKKVIRDLHQFIHKSSSGYKLVPETEKGDPVNPLQLSAAVFDDVKPLNQE